MTDLLPPRPRIGLLVPRFTAFDAALGPERVARLRARGPAFAAELERHADVVFPGLVEDPADAERVRQVLEAESPDAIVVAPAMAAPPGLGVVALGERPPPVVIWNAIAVDRLSDEAETGEAVEHTTSVGCLMLAGALARNGMRAAVLTTAPGDANALTRLHRTVRAAAAAGSLRGRTVVRIGEPPPGYVNVLAEAPELAHLGLAPAYVGRSDLDEAFAAATPADASAVLDELAEAGLAAERGPVAERSARLARAIETLLDEHAALCGAVNCLGPLLAQSDTIGTVACLAALRETARGRALACTADVPAAVAMHLGRRLGGAVLYGEWYTSEAETDTALFLGDGNADPAWADPEQPPRLVETQLRGIHAPGVGLEAALRRGPATLLGLGASPDGWRLAWATGEVVGARSGRLRGPNALFRVDGTPTLTAVSRLIASGITHHPVLVPGCLDEEVPVLADALGVPAIALAG